MNITPVLLVALALATPMAAAGGIDASITYLETSDDGCTSYGSHYSDYNSTRRDYPDGGYDSSGYGYQSGSYNQNCRSEFTTVGAEASDDSGSIASARVHGNDSESRRGSNYNSYSYWSSFRPDGNGSWSGDYSGRYYEDRSDYNSGNSAWHRSADVAVAGQSAQAGRGCWESDSSSYSHSRGSSGHYSNGSHSWSEGNSQSDARSYDSSCRDGVNAAGAGAGYGQNCRMAYSSSANGWSWSDSWGNGSYQNGGSSYSDECRTGVSGGKGDATFFAGPRFSCTSNSYGMTSDGTSYTSDEGRCANDLLRIEGPDGILLVVGTQDQYYGSCDSEDCYWSSYSSGGARLEWDHSPLGPNGIYAYQPLP